MEELSFLEKLQILGNNVIAHPFFLIILIVPMIIMFLERDTTKKEKDIKKIILLIYIIVIAVVLFIGGSTLFELFDNVVDGIFMTLYFPNFITLFVVIIISAIICLITVFRKKMPKAIRITNFVGFAVVQTLFCLVLVAIQSNDVNIYKENALYSNSDVLTLMQLLMGAFLLQIVTVCVITLINRITEMIEEKDNILSEDKKPVTNNEQLISNEIKEHTEGRPVVLQAKLVSLKDVSLKEKTKKDALDEEKKKKDLPEAQENIFETKPEKVKKDNLPKEKDSIFKAKPEKVVTPVELGAMPNIVPVKPAKPQERPVKPKPVKPDLMKPMEPPKPKKVSDLRNVVLTVSNLKIFKTKETIKHSRHMKYYKKVIIKNFENHPIENLEIIDFNLMVDALKTLNIKKIHTNKKN